MGGGRVRRRMEVRARPSCLVPCYLTNSRLQGWLPPQFSTAMRAITILRRFLDCQSLRLGCTVYRIGSQGLRAQGEWGQAKANKS
jgi:hypothetical protein